MIIGVLGQTLYTFLRKSEKFEILSDHGPCRGVYLDTQMRESNSVKSSCIRKGSLVWEVIFNANPRHCDSLDFKRHVAERFKTRSTAMSRICTKPFSLLYGTMW